LEDINTLATGLRVQVGCSAAEQLAHFGADIRVFHQRPAHQYGPRAALRQSLDLRAGLDAAYGNQFAQGLVVRIAGVFVKIVLAALAPAG